MFIETRELPVTAPTRIGIYHELAEAIRRGCKKTKYLRGAYVSPQHERSACALGAAAIGTGFRWQNGISPFDHLHFYFGYIFHTMIEGVPIHYAVASRNDRNIMTREEIADWLCKSGGCEHAL